MPHPIIQEFVSFHGSTKPKADIVERWETRVVANGWHLRGRAGADAYIGQYMSGVATPKVIGFARIAAIKGFPDLASRFWEHAFFLTTGVRASFSTDGKAGADVILPSFALKASFGRRPQLPIFTEHARIMAMLDDDRYGAQEKKDGRNLMVDIGDGRVSGGNKKGLAATVPLAAADAMAPLGEAQFDAENVVGTVWAFDLLSLNGEDLRNLGCLDRHSRLVEAAASADAAGAFQVIPMAVDSAAKHALFERVRLAGGEGLVFKRLDAPYIEGDAHGNQWKFQFKAKATFIVGARNGTKRSVQLLIQEKNGKLRDMGNLTVRGPVYSPGTIVEVEYLYCHFGPTGKLHIATDLGIRTDASAEDCLIDKVKFKDISLADDDE